MIRNAVYFIVIAVLIVELFMMLFYANWMTFDVTVMWTQSGVKS